MSHNPPDFKFHNSKRDIVLATARALVTTDLWRVRDELSATHLPRIDSGSIHAAVKSDLKRDRYEIARKMRLLHGV